MTTIKILLTIALLVPTAIAQVQAPQKETTRVSGTKVSLKPPAEFIPSTRFPGYSHVSLAASIMVTEMLGSFGETSAAFSKPMELATRGLSVLDKQEVNVDGQSGLLVKIQQNSSGTEYLKWVLIFGDEKETVIITAMFPAELEAELSQKMKSSIMTATSDRTKVISPTEGLNFSISEKGELKLAGRVSNSLMFTKGGMSQSTDINDPIFVIGQSISNTKISKPDEFAKARILQTTTITDFEIEQSNEVTIDNLNGYEIVARGKDKPSGQSMVIYQIVLFEESGYFLMQGLVSEKNRKANLEVFKEIARTFKRKPVS